jgi:hypothetical protein
MKGPLSPKKQTPNFNKTKLFNDKDQIKLEKIMSTRNLVKQKMAEKYFTNDIRKDLHSAAKKTISNVSKIQ